MSILRMPCQLFLCQAVRINIEEPVKFSSDSTNVARLYSF